MRANCHSYMSESQAFFLLSVLCDRLLPGYYSTTMYGTLLDQRVFESLVEKTMPILWDHLVKSDVQLSVVSLPWFLSLYINSMPLVFAFRVLDVFFLEGPKVLFQVGLAILRINGEELLDIQDDGTFISILKNYFSRLDESAHPKSENEKLRNVTKFQELMVVAFKEFAGITQNTISEQRTRHKDAVLDNIENFAKRTSIRNLGPESKRLSNDDLGFLYDRFYLILYERQQRLQILREQEDRQAKAGKVRASEIVAGVPDNSEVGLGRVGMGPSPTLMNYDAFREFLAGITQWAVTDAPGLQQKESEKEASIYSGYSGKSRSFSFSPWGAGNPEPADHDLMQRLYAKWNKNDHDGLSLQDVVTGLAHVKGTTDIMTSISYFFNLYDDDNDGRVDREGILRISEALLFLTRRGLGGNPTSSTLSSASAIDDDLGGKTTSSDERFLSSVSAFIRRCFEYADPDHPQNQPNDHATSMPHTGIEASLDSFTVGDDEDDEEDLLALGSQSNATAEFNPVTPTVTDKMPSNPVAPPPRSSSINAQQTYTANAALNPAAPLHMTLPTFRMVILADELLQQFFESAFSSSFILSTHPASSPTNTLTTFSSPAAAPMGAVTTSRVGGVVPPSKGLRGVLDNIVSDGMRVAGEVRKRVDEVGRDLERNALSAREQQMEDGDEPYGGDSDRKSVREGDRDLLEGADAVAGDGGRPEASERELLVVGEIEGAGGTPKSSDTGEGRLSGHKVVEFER